MNDSVLEVPISGHIFVYHPNKKEIGDDTCREQGRNSIMIVMWQTE